MLLTCSLLRYRHRFRIHSILHRACLRTLGSLNLQAKSPLRSRHLPSEITDLSSRSSLQVPSARSASITNTMYSSSSLSLSLTPFAHCGLIAFALIRGSLASCFAFALLLPGAFDRRYSDEPNSARDSATLNEGLQVRPFVVASHHRCACCALAAVNPRPTR